MVATDFSTCFSVHRVAAVVAAVTTETTTAEAAAVATITIAAVSTLIMRLNTV